MFDNLHESHFDVNSKSEFTWIDAKEAADFALYKSFGKYLSDIEIKLLQGSWEEKTYDRIAAIYGYSAEYLNKDVGNKLWHKLSQALQEKVTKKNFKAALRRIWEIERSSSNLNQEKIDSQNLVSQSLLNKN